MWIALMGLGGAGKTTLCKNYIATPKCPIPLFSPVYFVIISWLEEAKRAKELTDRCYYDRFISLASHKKIPMWLFNLLIILIPVPDYIVYLKISPEEAYRRKKEHTIDFIIREKKIIESIKHKKRNYIIINTEKNNKEQTKQIFDKIIISCRKYKCPYTQFIIDKDYSILKDNLKIFFEICWYNRMIFHYFSYVPEIKNMLDNFREKKNKTIQMLPNYQVLEKAVYEDVESDLDVLGEEVAGDFPLEVDFHKKLNYFGKTFKKEDIGLNHAVYETATCILRDYTESFDKYFDKPFPSTLKTGIMIKNMIKYPKLILNYFRCSLSWSRNRLPYYEPAFSKEEIKNTLYKEVRK